MNWDFVVSMVLIRIVEIIPLWAILLIAASLIGVVVWAIKKALK